MTAADTFADFVDHLSDALEQTESGPEMGAVSGEEWAARLHFSRFHFDRMITTTAPLLDIAVEAGYGSHEAFTRAFTTAYGAGPAAWRRKPGHIQIEAPSGVHFHDGGDLVSGGQAQAARRISSPGWSSTTSGSPASSCGWPNASPMGSSTSRSASTLTTTSSRSGGPCLGWWARWACGTPPWRPATTTGRSRSTSRCRRCGAGSRRRVRRTSRTCARSWRPAGLDDTFVDATCVPAAVFTYGGMIAHVLTFAAHRRTLVSLALMRHGIEELGWGDPMLWVAEQV